MAGRWQIFSQNFRIFLKICQGVGLDSIKLANALGRGLAVQVLEPVDFSVGVKF
ncbi:MAG: hypothetical protein LBP65_02580 [Puniceicoccales bacterium]|jgi:hypothetical protein|nr:hypothetical protein [Puniceicoccales bacterium]